MELCKRRLRTRGLVGALHMAEIQEEPFAIKRDTIRVIDRKGPEDAPGTQLSNFRCYQDRRTGHVVLYMTRYGENDGDWRQADYYRYEIEL